MTTPRIFMLLCLLALMVPAPAQAYFCWGAGERDPRDIMNGADVVFTGTIIALQPGGMGEMHTPLTNMVFKPERAWKGLSKEDTLKVNVDTEAFYEYDFQVGEKYLVYGFHLYPRRTSVMGCPRIQTEAQSADAIEKLGDPAMDFVDPASAAYVKPEEEKTKIVEVPTPKPAATKAGQTKIAEKKPVEKTPAEKTPEIIAVVPNPAVMPPATTPAAVPEVVQVPVSIAPVTVAPVTVKAVHLVPAKTPVKPAPATLATGTTTDAKDKKVLDVVWDSAAAPDAKKADVQKIKEQVEKAPEPLDVVWGKDPKAVPAAAPATAPTPTVPAPVPGAAQ